MTEANHVVVSGEIMSVENVPEIVQLGVVMT